MASYGNWNTRESRTLEMEKEVLAKIKANFSTTGKQFSFEEITAVLAEFNKTQETEDSTINLFSGSAKLKILNDFLTKNGFKPISIYNVTQACMFRQNTMADIAGSAPPGVILGVPDIGKCPTKRGAPSK